MKKILIIHSKYRLLGGEDIVVENETIQLKKFFIVKNLNFSNLKFNLLDLIYLLMRSNFSSNTYLQKVINEFNPDLVYIHNLWFKGNLGILKILKKNNIKTVIKFHNYRLFCIQGMHFRNNKYCNKCKKNRGFGLFYKCYKNSYFLSFLLTIFNRRMENLIQNSNFKIFVISEYHKNYLRNLNFNNNQIETVYNYLPQKVSINSKIQLPNKYILYLGRISETKGVQHLIESYTESILNEIKLVIIGELEPSVNLNLLNNTNIFKFDKIPNLEALSVIERAEAVVLPSLSLEGHPTIISEALSRRKIVICPNMGSLPEFFPKEYFFIYKVNDFEDLRSKLNKVTDKELMKEQTNLAYKYWCSFNNELKIITKLKSFINEK